MSAKVRLYSYTGVANAYVSNYAEQNGSNIVPMLKQRYLAGAVIDANTGAAQSTLAALAPTHTRLLRIQVQPGKRVHIEVNPNGQDVRTADANSPIYEGSDQIEFGSGWALSILEAAADA